MISAIFVLNFPICSNRIQPLYGTRYVQRNQVISKEIGELKSRRIYAAKRRCECFDFHKVYIPYKNAWSGQKFVVNERHSLINGGEDNCDTLIILQHPPVYTLGTGSSDKFMNFEIENAPHDIYRTERGGEVTYHGPGQIVMYPIINLRHHKQDLDWYLRSLEEVVIRAIWSAFSIKATRIDGLTGVWVGNQKIAAIGIKVSKWVTYHGLAINVTTDLTPFDHITPCGIQDRGVESIKMVLKDSSYGTTRSDNMLLDDTYKSLLREFSEVFQVSIECPTSPFAPMVQDILLNNLGANSV